LPSLRNEIVFGEVHRALSRAHKPFFRVLQFSVQTDHLHLVVEADSTLALTRGTQGLAIRCARAINRGAQRRGRVWQHRYHARELRTPREVRAAFVYVLLNFRKHLRAAPGIDPRSSGMWFEGWVIRGPSASDPAPVAAARTWLAAVGWRLAGGPIDHRESPRAPPAAALALPREAPCQLDEVRKWPRGRLPPSGPPAAGR
jgi:hypothetical protein